MTKKDSKRLQKLDKKLLLNIKAIVKLRKEVEKILQCEVENFGYNEQKDCVVYVVEGADDDYLGTRYETVDGIEELVKNND